MVGDVVAGNPESVIGWPTGRTVVPFYDRLTELAEAGELDLAKVRGFNLDELVLPSGDSRSFAAYMIRHVWGRTSLDRSRCDSCGGRR